MSAGSMIAFQNDAAAKAALLDDIDAADRSDQAAWAKSGDRVAAMPFSATRIWSDLSAFADRTGFPRSLIALLERLGRGKLFDPGGAWIFVHRWFDATPVGADLSRLPSALALWMLEDEEYALVDQIGIQVKELHLRDGRGDAPARGEWASVRACILARLDHSPGVAPEALARLALWEAAAWPAGTSTSILSDMAEHWVHLVGAGYDSRWSIEDEDRKEAILKRLWDECAQAREAGEFVDYPALFQKQDEDLERRFVAHLDRVNSATLSRWNKLAEHCLALLSQAGHVIHLVP